MMKENITDENTTLTLESVQKQIDELKGSIKVLSDSKAENKISMVIFSGALDKILAALVIGSGAVAMGMDV
ncbi:MAG: hypothetical protein OQJ74_04530, partial [Ignavibacteriaceae bacterium]|nr:hypothetical protein [Ignavibacteriaceae bacterium]